MNKKNNYQFLKKSLRALTLFLFLISCFAIQPAEARRFFNGRVRRGRRSNNSSARTPPANTTRSADSQPAASAATSSDKAQPAQPTQPSSTQPSNKWLAGTNPHSPVYPKIGPVKAVHVRPKGKESAGWTIYSVKGKDGYPIYRAKNEGTGVISGDGKGPSKVILSNKELDFWIMSDNGKWVRPQKADGSYGKYTPEQVRFYLDYNREPGSITVTTKFEVEKEKITKALGIEAKDLDLSAAKDVISAFGQAGEDAFKSAHKAITGAASSGLDQLKKSVTNFSNELKEGYAAMGEEANKLATASAAVLDSPWLKGSGFSVATEAILEVTEVPFRKVNDYFAGFGDTVTSQINLANMADDFRAADAMLEASRQRDLAASSFAFNPAADDGNPFEPALRESLAAGMVEQRVVEKLKSAAENLIARPVLDGFNTVVRYSNSEMNRLEANFESFAQRLVQANDLQQRSLIAVNRWGIAYSEIKENIPQFKAYDIEGWRSVKSMPATYRGEEILKAYTGRNLVDTKPDSIIAYWTKDSGFQAAAVWHYQKHIGSIPNDHFQGQSGIAKLNKPIKVTSQPLAVKDTFQQQKLENLTKVNLGAKGLDEDDPANYYGGPSAEVFLREQAMKQKILAGPKDTMSDLVNQYSSAYEGIIKSGGYRKLIEEGRPNYFSDKLTNRIHYRILADYAAKQATLAKKSGNWKQWAAWNKEYGRHNFKYNMAYLADKAKGLVSED